MFLGELDTQILPSIALVAYDANGYTFDTATGNYVSICYDENSQAYECTSGARILNIDTRYLGEPKTDYTKYIYIGGGLLLLLLVAGKR